MWWKCHVSWCWQTAVKAEPQRRLIQISPAVTAMFSCVTFCGASPTPPASVHWSQLWRVDPRRGNKRGSSFCSHRSAQWARSHQFSIIFSFSIVRALYSSSPPCISLGLSCRVELHRGRVTQTDWLMGGFCQLCLNKHKPFWASGKPGSLFRCFHPPHKLPHRWYAVHSLKIRLYCLRCGC